jgi:hypothetical protein
MPISRFRLPPLPAPADASRRARSVPRRAARKRESRLGPWFSSGWSVAPPEVQGNPSSRILGADFPARRRLPPPWRSALGAQPRTHEPAPRRPQVDCPDPGCGSEIREGRAGGDSVRDHRRTASTWQLGLLYKSSPSKSSAARSMLTAFESTSEVSDWTVASWPWTLLKHGHNGPRDFLRAFQRV